MVEINTVDGLGDFIEVEVVASDKSQKAGAIALVDEVFDILEIPEEDIEQRYYIDLLLEKKKDLL